MTPLDPITCRIGMTMGDPAGIGPEIVVRSWRQFEFHHNLSIVAIGAPRILQAAADRLAPGIQVCTVDTTTAANPSPALLPCLAATDHDITDLEIRRPTLASGQASHAAVVKAVECIRAGHLDGLVTAPISKVAWQLAGVRVPGHTELLAELCGRPNSAMMLYLPPGVGGRTSGLGIVHVTLHQALRRAIDAMDEPGIIRCTEYLREGLSQLGDVQSPSCEPKLGVCALNPHAGEQGLFGTEERDIIVPAVEKLRQRGHAVSGPFPADTLMARAVRGEFDGVVAMFHDQGHIALKLLTMHSAVNVTLGLPIVRTSVAHGTAFDIAWQGVAEIEGMRFAVDTCRRLVAGQRAIESTKS